jgi:hypothetical protein
VIIGGHLGIHSLLFLVVLLPEKLAQVFTLVLASGENSGKMQKCTESDSKVY